MRFCILKQLRVLFFAGDCSENSATIRARGTFIVPCEVRRVRVLAIGGGSGGLNGHYGGGGSGYVRSGEYGVTAGQAVPVTVGRDMQKKHKYLNFSIGKYLKRSA